jgi:hypothetical protein
LSALPFFGALKNTPRVLVSAREWRIVTDFSRNVRHPWFTAAVALLAFFGFFVVLERLLPAGKSGSTSSLTQLTKCKVCPCMRTTT